MIRRFARDAHDLGMRAVTDADDRAAFGHEPQHLLVHFGDEGAGRVNHAQLPRAGLRHYGWRHAMRRKQRHRARRNVRQPFDKAQAARGQPVGHLRVMHDFVQTVDRGATLVQRRFRRGHGAGHARAEAVRMHDEDVFGWHGFSGVKVQLFHVHFMIRTSSFVNLQFSLRLAAYPRIDVPCSFG